MGVWKGRAAYVLGKLPGAENEECPDTFRHPGYYEKTIY